NTLNGIETVRRLGLDAMEMEFVHSVNISREAAPLVKAAADRNNVRLTCHGQYYINLNSDDKGDASRQRVINAARISWLCGGWSVCFHAGYYMEQNNAYERVKRQIAAAVKTLRDEGNNIWVRPEVSGKPTQFGSLEEIVRLSEEIEGVLPCIDFSHLHARTNGLYNSREEFNSVLALVEKRLGRSALQNMHVHLSGIAYGPKGEKNHLTLDESDMNYRELVAAWKDFRIGGVVICESPNIEGDALMLKKIFESL
ncbi:MAG: TIM barrel protein, partial [Candidatus Aenigmarchaeota archaeon]|nr:TIM barrel protein [Candidatus Aenigmarchaeota archaeon]